MKTRRFKLAPSILSADFARLGAEVETVAPYSDLIHVDVMDGHFVPPISIGPVVAKALARVTDVPLECHLMVTNPEEQIEQFAEAGAESVVWHVEVPGDPRRVLKRVRGLGLGAGLALNPETPFAQVRDVLEGFDTLLCMTVRPGWAGQKFITDVLPKVREARDFVDRRSLLVDIGVDGGINQTTGRLALEAGANVLGAASAIFGEADPAVAARGLRDLLSEWEGR